MQCAPPTCGFSSKRRHPLGSCRAGVGHGKTAKSRKWGRKTMEIEMENGPKLDRSKKMAKKWPKKWKIMENSLIFCHFLPFFCLGPFSISIPFFSISGFWPFSMPYQPGRIPRHPPNRDHDERNKKDESNHTKVESRKINSESPSESHPINAKSDLPCPSFPWSF